MIMIPAPVLMVLAILGVALLVISHRPTRESDPATEESHSAEGSGVPEREPAAVNV